ncbi:MAG: hypothetical protein LW832_10215 [Parachlamydia sp.]|jgi:hypothetical protein|nr:hypothetical protein [Parachlamydia sp.]
MARLFIFLSLLMLSPAFGTQSYNYNPHVPCWDWFNLEPYFLPPDHPLKPKLDRLFSKRVTLSKETMEKAGFKKIHLRQPTNIVIGRHADLKGYLVKAYLDTQPPLIDWVNWVNRIKGAQTIQEMIDKYQMKDFLVPKKWIYPLPEHPSPPNQSGYHRKNFILVVEDMHILQDEDNRKAFQNKMTPARLKRLFILFTEGGLIDSIYPDNIPFTKKGKIAFIDTEHFHCWPVNVLRFKQFLSPAMQEAWQNLIDQK